MLVTGSITLVTTGATSNGTVTVTVNGNTIGTAGPLTINQNNSWVTIPFAYTATAATTGTQTAVATLSGTNVTAQAGSISITADN